MIFGEIKTESSLNGILASSLVLHENKDIIKVKKGTIINENLINLLLKNDDLFNNNLKISYKLTLFSCNLLLLY